jgi:arylsulfatase A-like enzyme
LITFDTMRADFLGCYGNRVTRTPTIDALARDGVVFDRAFAAVPFTPPSLWSLLYSEHVQSYTYETVLKDHYGKRGSVAGRFHDAGYFTVGVVGSSIPGRANGYAQGFDEYLDTYTELSFGNETTLARALELRPRLVAAKSSGKPYFFYIHFFDPHTPWGDAPPPFRNYPPEDGPFVAVARQERIFDRPNDFQVAREDEAVRTYTGKKDTDALKQSGEYQRLIIPMYRSEITWSDDVLRRLLDKLRGAGLLDHTVIAISSDHGIGLGEHYQTWGYVFPLFNEALRVPLVIDGAGIKPGRITQPVSLVDLGPTLLDLAGVAREHAEGRSFLPLMRGAGRGRPVYSEATAMPPELSFMIFRDDRGRFAPGVENRHSSLVVGHHKIIYMPARRGDKFELFDIEADPHERADIFDPRNPGHAALADEVLRRRHMGREGQPGPIDPEAAERLRALGYIR